MPSQHNYARTERERRFLLSQFPRNVNVVRIRRLTDFYIDGTALRLREESEDGGPTSSSGLFGEMGTERNGVFAYQDDGDGISEEIAVSPDGRTILYTQLDEAGADLMLVENFR